MKTFEYDFRTFEFKQYTELLDALNIVGTHGWEVVQWKEIELGSKDHTALITMKRFIKDV